MRPSARTIRSLIAAARAASLIVAGMCLVAAPCAALCAIFYSIAWDRELYPALAGSVLTAVGAVAVGLVCLKADDTLLRCELLDRRR